MIKTKLLHRFNKIMTIVCLFLMLLNCAVYPIARAAELESTSSAEVQSSSDPDVEIINDNEAVVENDLDAEATSGQENVSDTDGDVDLSSDDANASTDLYNETNSTDNEIGAPDTGSIDAEVTSDNTAGVNNQMDSTAQTGSNNVSDTDGDVDIDSQEATGSAHLVNSVNTNSTEVTDDPSEASLLAQASESAQILEENLEASSSGQATESAQSSSSSESSTASASGSSSDGQVDLEVNNNNQAVVENEINVQAGSGANSVEDTDGDVNLTSDEATAIANLLNFVNTNLTGSEWIYQIIDILGVLTGNINLLEDFLLFAGVNSIGDLTITNTNEGTLINEVNVSAESGGNTVNNTDGDVTISAGNANVLVNLINFLNSNFTGSNWLFSVINIFGSLLGDIILPGEGSGGAAGSFEDVNVENNNQANVVNDLQAFASSGVNQVSDTDGEVNIENGGTFSKANLLQFINTNIFGLDWIFLIVNRFGNWVGQAINGPEPLQPSTPDVFIYAYALNGLCDEGGKKVGPLSVKNDNKASLVNNVQAHASTGQNTVSNTDGDVNIKSGNSRSLVNVINFVNTNIIGSNWLFGIVNIFGDWQGDLIFAYSDLIINKTDGRESANPGETLTYTISYENQGQMRASSVRIVDTLPEKVTYVSDTSGATPAVSDHTYIWSIGDLNPGASGSFEVMVTIDSDFETGTHYLDDAVLIHTCSQETDENNNTDTDRTRVDVYPDLIISKTDERDHADPGQEITYKIDYKNQGIGDAENVFIKDELPDHVSFVSASHNGHEDNGLIVWSLGTIKAGQSGQVTLTVNINSSLPSGEMILKNKVKISTDTQETNSDNNVAYDETKVEAYPVLEVSKENNASGVMPIDSSITFKIKIKNTGQSKAFSVILNDILRDENNNEVLPQSWDIGEIWVDEEVIVEYTLSVTEGVSAGKYTNTAKAEGKDDRGNGYVSNEAKSTIEVGGGIVLMAAGPTTIGAGEILGAVTELPAAGDNAWMLTLAGICLMLAGILFRYTFFQRPSFCAPGSCHPGAMSEAAKRTSRMAIGSPSVRANLTTK